jgi:CDP-glycerol glycerophosphotransferase
MNYRKSCDVYPLLTKCDLMITDYSSIFVDYIIQDKPVVFFPFDYHYYVNNARALQFDYDDVTPGRKCFTYEDLETELRRILVDGVDEYREKRKDVLRNFFDSVDGNSCARILHYIEKNK